MAENDIKFTIERLKGAENYPAWVVRMTQALKAQGLWHRITAAGGTPGNSATGSEATEATATTGENAAKEEAKALHIIMQACDDTLLQTLSVCTTASQAWLKLKELFAAAVAARADALVLEINQLQKLPSESVQTYINRAQVIKAKLAEVNRGITENDLARFIIRGLPPSYATWRTTIDVVFATQQLTLATLTPLLLAEEAKQPSESLALAAQARLRPMGRGSTGQRIMRETGDERRCYVCGTPGHIAKDCPNKRRGGAPMFATAL